MSSAHLVEPTHSTRFWRLVDRYPDAAKAKGYLEGYAAGVKDGAGGPAGEAPGAAGRCRLSPRRAGSPWCWPGTAQPRRRHRASTRTPSPRPAWPTRTRCSPIWSRSRSGIAGPPEVEELLWPGAVRFPVDIGTRDLADRLADEYDELVIIPADAPDLPGLVLAKLFKVLHRVDLAVAPERGGSAAVAARTGAAAGAVDPR